MAKTFISWKSALTLLLIAYTFAVFSIPLNGMSRTFLMLSCLNFVFFSNYYKNIYNPASVFASLFLFMIGCSQARLTPIEQDPWDVRTWEALFAALATFYAVSIRYMVRYGKLEPRPEIVEQYQISGRTLFISNIICLLAELAIYSLVYKKLGVAPIFNDNIRANVMPNVISNYLMTLMVIPVFFIIFNTVYIVQSKKYLYFLFSAIYIIMLASIGGRINVFIPVITSLFFLLVQYVFNKKNLKHVIASGIVTVIATSSVMVAIPLIRTAVYSNGSGSNYYETIYSKKTDVMITSSSNDSGNFADSEENAKPDDANFNPTVKLPAKLLPVWINFSSELHAFNKMVI